MFGKAAKEGTQLKLMFELWDTEWARQTEKGSLLPSEYVPRDYVRAAKIGKLYTFVITKCPHSIF